MELTNGKLPSDAMKMFLHYFPGNFKKFHTPKVIVGDKYAVCHDNFNSYS